MEEMESICFRIISNAGQARSLIFEALQDAKGRNYFEAESKITEANKFFIEAHNLHTKLIQKEAQGNEIKFSLLLMHAEDQLMSTETIKHLVNEVIAMYKICMEANKK